MNIEGKYASEKGNLNLTVKNATMMVSYKLDFADSDGMKLSRA